MKVFIAISLILVGAAAAQQVAQPGFYECFEKDSISCVQSTVRNGLQCINNSEPHNTRIRTVIQETALQSKTQ